MTTKTVFSQIFAVGMFAIQAPLLGPRAFGLVSIVLVFVGFCELLLDDAAGEALISIRSVEPAHFNVMNTANVSVSLGFGTVMFCAAGAIAKWFGDPELVPMVHLMSLLPVISALAAAPTAATKREMLFRPLALRSMLSLCVGGLVGLALVLSGFGVWSLVWQAIVSRLIACVVLWLAVPLRLRFGFSRVHLMQLMPFAIPVMLSRGMGWATSQFPRLIFGLYWGPTELGIFGLASRLCDVLLEVTLVPRYAVARVELRQYATDRVGLLESLPRLLTNVSVICFPLAVGGAAVAPTLFHVWLDSRWYPGVAPAQFMMLMCVPFVAHYIAGATLMALNYPFAEALIAALQSALTVVAVMVFAPFGLIPATAAFAARPLLLLPLPALLMSIKCKVPARVLFAPQLPPLLAAIIMGVGVTAVRAVLESRLSNALLLPLLIVVGAMIYTGMIAWLLPDLARQYLAKIDRKHIA